MIRRIALSLCLFSGLCNSATSIAAPKNIGSKLLAKDATSVNDKGLSIVYLGLSAPSAELHPFFDPAIQDAGIRGAELGIDDDNTTGRFTGQTFKLTTIISDDISVLKDQFKKLLLEKKAYFLLDLPVNDLLEMARLPEASHAILMDIANSDDRLRGRDCQANVFLLMPSDAMRTDALAQYFAKKHWQKRFLVSGQDKRDVLVAQAARHSAKKFGAKIIKDTAWSYHFEDRRTPESEIPVFTQGDDYDLVFVADHQRQFADLFPYRTWQPKLVTGDAGLVAGAWHKAHEAWGALQLQTRFRDKYARLMQEKDYTAWLAVRSLGEAATRGHTTTPDRVREMLLDPAFSLAGFKGVPLSFRSWDHQMRQPILLGSDRSIAAFAPIEGYLHPSNTLDTLGYDSPESECKLSASLAATSP